VIIPGAWSIWARVAGPLVVLGLAGAAYWSHGVRERRAGLEEGRAEILSRWTADVNEANRRAALAGDRYTLWQAAQRHKLITRTVEVSRALDADPWAALPVPGRVRDAIERAAADTGAGESHPGLPAVPAAPDQDAR
jgi:hypothetical protein